MRWQALTDVVWGMWLVVAVTLELLARARRPTVSSLGDLLVFCTARTAGRVVVLLAWMWLGWHAFAR